MARARCPRSSVGAGQKCVQILLTFGNRCLLALLWSLMKEFVVDSGASAILDNFTQWLVANTLFLETIQIHNQKDGFKET